MDTYTDIATLWKNRPRADSLKIQWMNHNGVCPAAPAFIGPVKWAITNFWIFPGDKASFSVFTTQNMRLTNGANSSGFQHRSPTFCRLYIPKERIQGNRYFSLTVLAFWANLITMSVSLVCVCAIAETPLPGRLLVEEWSAYIGIPLENSRFLLFQ